MWKEKIENFEMAFRMQTSIPRVQDISNESEATKNLYGLDQKFQKISVPNV